MALDPRIALRRLPDGRWMTWPSREQDAVEAFLNTLWRVQLAPREELPLPEGHWLSEEVLAAILQVVPRPAVLLEHWPPPLSEEAGATPMRVNPAGLRDSPGRSGVPTEIAYRGLCHLIQPNLEDLHLLDFRRTVCSSYPHLAFYSVKDPEKAIAPRRRSREREADRDRGRGRDPRGVRRAHPGRDREEAGVISPRRRPSAASSPPGSAPR